MPFPRPAPFRTTLEVADATTQVLACYGELDMASTPSLCRALETVTAPSLVIDLSALQFLDSIGLEALLRVRKERSDRLAVVAVGGPVGRILEVTNLHEVLRVRATVTDAVAAAAGPADTPTSAV